MFSPLKHRLPNWPMSVMRTLDQVGPFIFLWVSDHYKMIGNLNVNELARMVSEQKARYQRVHIE